MKEAFDLIRKKDVLEIIHSHSCNTARIEEGVLNLPIVEAEYGNGCGKQTYEICLNGCDDDTVFKMDLTDSEYRFLLKVSELANKTSTYGCMPRLYVEEYTPTTD